eukprot:CAMPEP_0168751398 /NCGR_PEP_ID=MMETSP0724-20121128/17802_1 /TAXON_ID=265536 /ORGANISM="Amphiprora sp., Strain CCMP467" /LENGTH=111 /DNA_ID=CAMNT_0008799519 /DNA_START=31 /DNA_END=366 /DNA_ORIENTATION=-
MATEDEQLAQLDEMLKRMSLRPSGHGSMSLTSVAGQTVSSVSSKSTMMSVTSTTDDDMSVSLISNSNFPPAESLWRPSPPGMAPTGPRPSGPAGARRRPSPPGLAPIQEHN